MNDQLIRDLLHEVADDIEPGDRLDAIRAATAPAGRRTQWAWWAAGGAGLLAASVVTAVALTTGGAPQSEAPGPADGPATSASLPTTDATDDSPTSNVVAVYFVGDTAQGPRLYREFRPRDDAGSPAVVAIEAALRGDTLDPDYRSPWPAGVELRQWIVEPDVITVILEGAPTERPPGMSREEADLALEQLVRTAQAAYGHGKVPVDVQVEQQVTDSILGVETTAPLTGSPDADVLAPVSLSDPSEGRVVHADKTVWVTGRAVSADDRVSVRVQRWEGTAVVMGPSIITLNQTSGPPGSFGIGLQSDDLQPGQYSVIATVQNADGTYDSDTRRITVVE